jgi:hypothetical protein
VQLKNKNMKQLLSLFLFLLPCLALAQYPSNGNQKITLGEQTTADGLIFRGVATDTVRKPSIDTMAYMVLDTTTNIMWHYKKATSNAWLRLNLLPSDTASMLTNYWRSGRFSGTLPVANGGTGANMSSLPNNYLIRTNSSGIFDTSAVYEAGGNVGIGSSNPLSKLQIGDFLNTSGVRNDIIVTGDKVNADGYFARLMLKNSDQSGGSTASIRGERASTNAGTALTFYTNTTSSPGDGDEKMRITSAGNIGIGTASPQSGYRLHVVDSIYVGGNVSASAYTTRSDFNLKDDIFDLKYGLNDILKLQPVEYTYKSNGSKQLGFIAQDIGTILPEVVSFEESMSVNYQAIIPILTKAIQEQQALIKALEQRIINLENK